MARLLLSKLASVAALISTAMLASGCETSAGKPVVTKPDLSRPEGPFMAVRVRPVRVKPRVQRVAVAPVEQPAAPQVKKPKIIKSNY